MKLLSRVLLLSVGLLSISVIASAQPRPPHHRVRHPHHPRPPHHVHHRPHHPRPPHH